MDTPKQPPSVATSALVRHCNKCLAVTAFDLDATCANEKALRKRGQTVRIMDAAEVLGMKLARCKCLPNAERSQKQGALDSATPPTITP